MCNRGKAMNIRLIILFFFSMGLLAKAQVSQAQTEVIDSLKKVIKNAKHDTARINAWRAWDNIIYLSNPDLDIRLNEKIDSISSTNLSKKLNQKERVKFLKSKGSALNNFGIIYTNKGNYAKAVNC